jgi:hypothetical protein
VADDNNRNHGPADDEDDLENGVGPDEGDELEDMTSWTMRTTTIPRMTTRTTMTPRM